MLTYDLRPAGSENRYRRRVVSCSAVQCSWTQVSSTGQQAVTGSAPLPLYTSTQYSQQDYCSALFQDLV